MPISNYLTPNIYVEEVSTGPSPIEALGTSVVGFLGRAPNPKIPVGRMRAINNWTQFRREFANSESIGTERDDGTPRLTPLAAAVFGFFQNGGSRCYVLNVGEGTLRGDGSGRNGIDQFEAIDEIAIVAAPGFIDAASYDALLEHCEKLKDRIAILDGPQHVDDVESLTRVASVAATSPSTTGATATAPTERPKAQAKPDEAYRPRDSKEGMGACYYPWITIQNPFAPREMLAVPPSGHVAGIYARTDARRGVHKAPANEPIRGALGVSHILTDAEQAVLNPRGVNAIRFFQREGVVVWGARTVAPSSSEWRYLSVRRLFCMIEKSIARSTRWVVFENNDEPLWQSIRRDVSAFLTLLWREGALVGATPADAFFVQCDRETNPPEVVDAGQVITVIGVAPVKPAEFIIFRIGQSSGGAEITG